MRRRSRTDSFASRSTVDSDKASAVTDENDDYKFVLNIQRIQEADYMQDDFLASLDLTPEPREPTNSNQTFIDKPLVAYLSPRESLSPSVASMMSHNSAHNREVAEDIRQQKQRRDKVDNFLRQYASRPIGVGHVPLDSPRSTRTSAKKTNVPSNTIDVSLVSIPVMLYGEDEDIILPSPREEILVMDDELSPCSAK